MEPVSSVSSCFRIPLKLQDSDLLFRLGLLQAGETAGLNIDGRAASL